MPAPRKALTNLPDAIEAYERGDSGFNAAAKRYGVPTRRLRDALKDRGTLLDQNVINRAGITRGQVTRILTAADLPTGDICDSYLAGASENEIAKMYGLSRQRVGNVLRKAGVERRSVSEANRVAMSRRSPEENARNTQAAHDAVRGKRYSFEEKCARARRLHGKPQGFATELLYQAWLKLRHIDTVAQHAIGPYNCDLTAEPVAVEVFGGHWHGSGKHAATFPERSRYILDHGWNLMIVWVNQSSQRLSESSADYVAAFIEESRRDPTLRGEYRVVWGDGQVVSTIGKEVDDFALVPARRRRPQAR